MDRNDALGSPHDRLIRALAGELTPVRPLASPMLRALGWLLLVAIVGAGLASVVALPTVWQRVTAAPDLYLAVVGSTATMALAAIAAFQLSVPDRSSRWILLPLPAVLLWIGASGAGCLRDWLAPDLRIADMAHARDCLIFILGFSVPLSAVLIVMLRRACPLSPGLTAVAAGLAAAAAAATLLNFVHPFDAAATDLSVHAVAVALVIALNRAFGGRLLAINFSRAAVTSRVAGPNGR